MHSGLQDSSLWSLYGFGRCLVHSRGSMTRTRRCHLLTLLSGGSTFSLIPFQACGSSFLGQKQQLGPNLRCVHRKLHKGLRMESIWGCVRLSCWDRWGTASSSDRRERPSPPSTRVSNRRGSFPSLEIKQIQIDEGMGFLGKRGKQFSNVLSELLCCTSGWGEETCSHGESKRSTP